MIYSFHWGSLLFPSLNLFLSFSPPEATANGIVFLISFSVCSLLVYKKSYHFLYFDFISCFFTRSVYDF
jgi:uncharacterized membrane protein YfcA